MLFRSIVSAALFAASTLAIQLNSWPSSVVAGQTYTITWSGADTTPVTLLLRQGSPNNLQTVGTITSAGTGGSFSWTAPATYPPGSDYAIEILQGDATNYSGQFTYTGGSAVSSAATSASATASASTGVSSTVSVTKASNATTSTSSSATALTSSNSTTTKSTLLSTSAKLTATSSTAKPTTGPANNMASAFQSPLALILGVVAAMIYFQ